MPKLIDVNPFKKGHTYIRKMDELEEAEEVEEVRKSPGLKYLGGLLVLIAGLLLVWKLLMVSGFLPSATFPAIDKNKWQAVFVSNGLSYFGHLQEVNKTYVVLKDAYYLRAAAAQQNNLNLIKLGNEIYSPEDEMYLPKAQILFWQNMRNDSQVVKLIQQTKGK